MTKITVSDYLNPNAKSPKPIPNTKTITGQLGERLAKIYSKSKSYQKADLSQAQFEPDGFRRQVGKLGQLFAKNTAPKATQAYQLMSKFGTHDRLSAATDVLYQKLAVLAEKWAVKSLAKDERFGQVSIMTLSEKHAFADDVANQARTLVSVGGVAGFFGFKGVVADTAWLLLVSLKSIYQLSYIYGKPLSDKDGVRLAYGVLASCELEKLQEKQVILTALAVGDSLLKNAQETSVLDELKTVARQYQANYADNLDIVADFVDLDKLNGKWLPKFLNIVSVGVSVHYNNVLLEEVLGVAKATFGEEVLLIENGA